LNVEDSDISLDICKVEYIYIYIMHRIFMDLQGFCLYRSHGMWCAKTKFAHGDLCSIISFR